ncbi:hypothetical protein Tco_0737285 [Tanacetum coccineum]
MSDHDDDASDINNDNAQPQQQTKRTTIKTYTVTNNNANLKRTGRDRDRRVIILPPTTTDEHIAVQRESKARTTLLQSIPDDKLAEFPLY